MSHDQSRFEKKREGHPRKSGRNGNSGSHRGFSDGGEGTTSGGSASQPSSMDQSFKKSGNGQRGQPTVNPASVSSEANITTYAAAVQNGAHGRPPSFGLPNAPLPTATAPIDSGTPRTSTALPKATPPQYPAETSSLHSPSTPDKGDGAKPFPFQFGSISPGIVDRMQIPVRTTSAPPNLDERKQGQANQEPFKAMPTLPIPSGPKQQQPLPRKDVRSSNQSTVGESHSPGQLKRDSHPQISNVAVAPPSKPATLSIRGISTAMPFQQKVHMQYGCPRPQQIPMSLPIGNDHLGPQQMFVHNFQHHPFQPHPMIHQGQSLGFARPIISPQFAHPGFCIPTQQFVQQQPEKFGEPHKPTVTITDPETHEVLMLDKRTNLYTDGGSWGQMSLPNATTESQQVPSPFSTSSYFPQLQQNSYFIPPSTPLLSSSQASRFSYPAGQHGPAISTVNPFVPNSMICSNSMPPFHTYLANLSPPVYVPSAPIQGSAKPTVIPFGPKVGVHQPSESKVFADATQQQPEMVSEIPGISKNVSNEDIRNRHFPTNLDNNQDSSGESVSTTIANLPHGRCKSSITEVRTGETTEEKIVRSGSGSSGVILKKEELPDVPQICSNSVELVTEGEIPMKDKGTSETSMTSGPEMEGSISKDFGSTIHQADHHSPEVETKKGVSGEKQIRHSEVSFTSILDCRNAKVHPVPTAADTSETLKPVVSVRKKDSGEDSSEKLIVYNRQESQKQQFVSLSVQKIAEVKDGHAVAFPATSKAEAIPSSGLPAVNNIKDGPSSLHVSTNKSETVCSGDIGSSMPGTPHPGSSSVGEDTLQAANKLEIDVTELHREAHAEASKGKSTKESNRSKPIAGKKKKRRGILSKADAGTAGTSDLYNAYKAPEERHQIISTSGGDHSIIEDGVKVSAEDSHKNVGAGEKQSKAERNGWEDAAYAATPKLENGDLVKVVDKYRDSDENEATDTKKYTQDFLLTFSDKCTDLPIGFEIGSDIASALMSVPVSSSHVIYRDHNPSPGRIKDRMPAVSRGDRCMIGSMDDDKWIKRSGSFNLHDPRGDVGHGAVLSFRPGQGLSHGILRNPRGPPPNYFLEGILSGPMQSPEAHGVLVRNGSGVDSWRSSNSRGLMPHPQTTMQVMHKAEKKYEVGKVSDEEEVKQRRLKAILNKLTPQNFEKLFEQVKEVNIDNTVTLAGVISQIFDKALMEPTFCEMYANFCFHMSSELPDFIENDDKITFRRLLLSKCQEEFERGEREQAEANRDGEEEEIKQSEEVKEEKRIKARRRMLGNIRLIGELYKKRMLTESIMHECIKKLLGQYQNPDEEDIEALCKLLSTIGGIIDHPKAKKLMDAYFSRMLNLSTNEKLSSRIRFLLRDAIDLRKNKWQQRRKTEGPKKIEEVHRDAAQERQSQASRLTRGPSINSGARRGPPVDYGPWGPNVSSSPRLQIGGIHGFAKVREHGIQDARLEEQHQLENRILPVLLPQRRTDGSSIILGPQGGLARGTSATRQPLISSVPLTEISSNSGDLSRKMAGPNGHITASDRTPNSSSNRDSIDRYATSTEPGGRSLESLSGSSSDAKSLSEDLLRKKSISTIREFYSAKDEEEVALCIKELDSPSFHPSMVSLWVTDSFERKDTERGLLATLLVNLCKSQDGLLSHVQLTQGFEYVLSSLEDAVNDAPKAAEFLGCIFAKVILENVVPLRDIGTLIHEGGEEPGRLLEVGLASDVLGSILEIIRMEKGDPFVQDIRMRSNLHLPDFLPPHPVKSKKLDAFL
ncbi:eukaryotic translation initiation factor 4G-like [Iris pallida]|uniref:Eukaryotic translation initiation factor 4G n=1 Tax=Iris pallida TaxID=29817 RepID=A0AAX6GC69_IRIPA|nr:eukaryotic translation initiation factor 4G-like [Iris pallida]